MPSIVKGNTGTLSCSWEVEGAVCCCLLVYRGTVCEREFTTLAYF